MKRLENRYWVFVLLMMLLLGASMLDPNKGKSLKSFQKITYHLNKN